MKMPADGFTTSAVAKSSEPRSNCRPARVSMNARHAVLISSPRTFGLPDRKDRSSEMSGSAGRKTVAVMRGLMMLCDSCYDQVIAEHLTDHKNFVQNYEALFDTICPGCTDINRPLVDDMLGSSE